jgi:U3 small nucleolar RNA-associated protein 14
MDKLKKIKKDLRIAGIVNPELLMKKLQRLGLSNLELEIIKERYIDIKLIKEIAYNTGHCEAWIKKAHQKVLTRLLDLLNTADLRELGVASEATLRTLYQI